METPTDLLLRQKRLDIGNSDEVPVNNPPECNVKLELRFAFCFEGKPNIRAAYLLLLQIETSHDQRESHDTFRQCCSKQGCEFVGRQENLKEAAVEILELTHPFYRLECLDAI